MIPLFRTLFGDGSHLGLKIQYAIQDDPRGIAEALIIGEDFIGNDNVALILGDNIFISDALDSSITNSFDEGATIFTVKVNDPERYGVVKFSEKKIEDIVEKPKLYLSNQAVTGLYLYDHNCVQFAKSLKPSQRGEIEITDLNKIYLNNNNLNAINLGENASWMDAGTFNSLLEASNLIHTLQKRHGRLFGSPEIASLQANFINQDQLKHNLSKKPKNSYYKKILSHINPNV